jgi:nitroreductase
MRKPATTTVPVHPLLAERWSPRGFDRHHQVSDDQVTALLEAARWAPSAGNSQPWRFLVTHRGDLAHRQLFAALAPGNRDWADAASALVLVAARTAADGTPQPWAFYDTGQAVASLVTQAQAQGLSVHQIGGFDSDAVRTEFALDRELTPVVVLAVGRADPDAELPSHLAAREAAPRTRHPVSDLLLTSAAATSLSAA